jgi:deoxyhypusine monooxygenase
LGTPAAVRVVCDALRIRADGELMRHELAYILGQMGNVDACPALTAVLEDEGDDVLVRHESAEALGAIGAATSLPVLEKYSTHVAPEIAETCQIAIDLIHWRQQQQQQQGAGSASSSGSYLSHDPAPAIHDEKLSIPELQTRLMDPSLSLFQRYRAMFSLRDMNSDAAALALIAGFQDRSALFRHEVAFVLGQMQRPATVEGLAEVLKRKDEHRMVRHEAAEALGAIGGPKVEEILQLYLTDDERVVTESCEVALDAMDYWNAFGSSS